MEKMHSLKDLSLEKARVLVRVDFNVPLSNGKIVDNSRIKAALPTIEYLLSKNCALILMSHLGKVSEHLSLTPIREELSKLLHKPVKLAPDCVGDKTEEMVKELKPGEILLLENLRFHEAEVDPKLDSSFSKKLANYGDYYIADAFGCAHRAHASIVDVPRILFPKCAPGFLMEKEIAFLGDALKNPKRPFLVLIGGAKISSKFGVLKTLVEKADCLAVGGGMAFTFLKAKGIEIGDSLVEESFLDFAKTIIGRSKSLLLPQDVVITNGSETKTISISEGIPKKYQGVDIGPETVKLFLDAIAKAKTILWNGPMGVFEKPEFAKGTQAIGEGFANSSAITIAGGGETAAALANLKDKDKICHISTGGGASLEFLEFGTLPGIDIFKLK